MPFSSSQWQDQRDPHALDNCLQSFVVTFDTVMTQQFCGHDFNLSSFPSVGPHSSVLLGIATFVKVTYF